MSIRYRSLGGIPGAAVHFHPYAVFILVHLSPNSCFLKPNKQAVRIRVQVLCRDNRAPEGCVPAPGLVSTSIQGGQRGEKK
jgi:hypothetical protein